VARPVPGQRRENTRLKALVGELALELKKSEEVLG
jgi:hypothetical protein